MQIDKKRFPVKLEPKQVIEIIKTNLKKKGYKLDISPKSLYLTLTPYWVCYYDILSNYNGKFEQITGQIAINSISNKINEKVVLLFAVEKPRIMAELHIPKTDKTQIVLKKSIISQKEAEKTITNYLAQKYNVKIEEVFLSGVEEIIIPNWKLKILNTKIKLDAITGEVNDFEKIKDKEQTQKELFFEMLEDIRSPKKVANYTFNIFNEIGKGFVWLFEQLKQNFKIILWILLVSILIYLILL